MSTWTRLTFVGLRYGVFSCSRSVNSIKACDHDQRTVAEALLPTLKKELEHLSLSEVIRRPRESEVRATCGRFASSPRDDMPN